MMKAKYLPLLALTVICAACAAPMNTNITEVGSSAKAPADVAQCIATTWADKAQLPVTSQTAVANDIGVNVYLPGAPADPAGPAAIVRPARSGSGSWVGFRSGGSAQAVPGDIAGCL
jgi:hypothetical protein